MLTAMLLMSWTVVAGAGVRDEHSLQVGNQLRWTTVYVPENMQRDAPVVMLLHGGGQSMRKILAEGSGGTSHWLQVADREGFLLLVPNAANARNGDPKGDRQNWNDLRPATAKAKSSADDVAFLMRLLDWAHDTYHYDPRRVYVTGASNGGMMTMRLLLEKPERFAAAAAFVASLPAVAPTLPGPGKRVPLMLFNGTKDPLIQWPGGMIKGNRGETMAIEPMVDWWKQVNGVDRTNAQVDSLPDRDPQDGCRIERTAWSAPSPGAPLVFYKAEGGGHALPSMEHPVRKGPLVRRLIGPVCRDAEGAELAWEFMKAYRN